MKRWFIYKIYTLSLKVPHGFLDHRQCYGAVIYVCIPVLFCLALLPMILHYCTDHQVVEMCHDTQKWTNKGSQREDCMDVNNTRFKVLLKKKKKKQNIWEIGDGCNTGIVVTASLSPIRDNIRVMSSISCITTPSLIVHVNLHDC